MKEAITSKLGVAAVTAKVSLGPQLVDIVVSVTGDATRVAKSRHNPTGDRGAGQTGENRLVPVICGYA